MLNDNLNFRAVGATIVALDNLRGESRTPSSAPSTGQLHTADNSLHFKKSKSCLEHSKHFF